MGQGKGTERKQISKPIEKYNLKPPKKQKKLNLAGLVAKSEIKEVKQEKKKLNMGAFANKNQSQVQEAQKILGPMRARSNSDNISFMSSFHQSSVLHSGEKVNNGAKTHANVGGRRLVPKDCFAKKFIFRKKQ